MAVPEGSLVAAVERMSRALEQLAEAPSVEVVLDEVLRLAAASLWADRASVTWRDESGQVRTRALAGLEPEAAAACGQRLLEVPGAYLASSLAQDALLGPLAGPQAAALLAVHTPGDEGVLLAWYLAPRGLTQEDARRLGLYARLAHLALGRERLMQGARLAAAQARAEAEQAEVLRLAHLQEVSEALAGAVTREEVAQVVLAHGPRAVQARSATVHLCQPEAGEARLLGCWGLEEGGRHATDPRAPGRHPAHEAYARGEPLWVESLEEVRARYPDFVERVEALPRGAFAFLPLRWKQAVLGVLSFGFEAPRRFSALERASLQALARQCAQALERAHLYERERQARLEAEAAGRGLQLLADASELLSGSLDWEATAAGVARLALQRGFADWCAVDVLEGEGMRRLVLLHADPARASHAEALKLYLKEPRGLPSVAEVLRTGRLKRVASTSPAQVEAITGDGQLARLCEALGLACFLVVPLVARGRTLGTVSLVRGPGRPGYEAADETLAEALAARASLAMDNARLLRQARLAEEESRRSAARLHVLAQVSQRVAEAGLDLDSVLEVVASKVCEALGEACVVWLLEEEGRWLEAVAVHHAHPEARARLAEALRTRRPVDEGLARHVVGQGQPLLLPHLTPEELLAQAPQYSAYAGRQGPLGLMAVPLKVRGRVLGSLEVLRQAQGPACGLDERALLEGVAARAALAIEDARLYGEATQAVRAREDLLSVAGHELKTPLNALQLQIHMLARTARELSAEPRLAERAERAMHTSERLRLLLDELMDVGRIRAGRLQLAREELDLAALAREAVARMAEELARAGCEVRLEAASPVRGAWDRLRLEQVLINLLSNAAKYAPGGPVEVAVGQPREHWARLHVKDSGQGVAPEDVARIFQRFERAPATPSIHGLGLGLWITRQIVEAHGGLIRVEGAPGQGATFVVELPLRVPAPG